MAISCFERKIKKHKQMSNEKKSRKERKFPKKFETIYSICSLNGELNFPMVISLILHCVVHIRETATVVIRIPKKNWF